MLDYYVFIGIAIAVIAVIVGFRIGFLSAEGLERYTEQELFNEVLQRRRFRELNRRIETKLSEDLHKEFTRHEATKDWTL